MSATTRVFGTYELLEEILLHLPLRDILFAQAVNTYFRDLIWDSGKINKALFFAPTNDNPTERPECSDDCSDSDLHAEDDTVSFTILNPFLELLLPWHQLNPHDSSWCPRFISSTRCKNSCWFVEEEYASYARFDKYYPGFFWRRGHLNITDDESCINSMLLTDPPLYEAWILGEEHFGDPLTWEYHMPMLSWGPIQSEGLCFSDLRDWDHPPENESHNRIYKLDESPGWIPIPKGYETTGWEMLSLLQAKGESRKHMLKDMYLGLRWQHGLRDVYMLLERGGI